MITGIVITIGGFALMARGFMRCVGATVVTGNLVVLLGVTTIIVAAMS